MKVRWWFAVGHGGCSQREAGRSRWLQKQIKGFFLSFFLTQKIPFSLFFSASFFFLLNLQIGALFVPASSAFVHFVSGFNAGGLNCCCGSHCLCFPSSPAALPLSRDIIDRSPTIWEVHLFPFFGEKLNSGRIWPPLFIRGNKWHNMCFLFV